ncbi:S-isoprenylcysteine O-methyltransferase [Carex rostrata]
MADALTSYTAIRQISQFVGAIVFFHVSEYFLAIFFHGRSNVSCSSLLITKHYAIAMGFALVEYVVELTLFPQMKNIWFLSNCGLVMIIIGEVIRKAAIVTAGRSFTHLIRIYYEEQHELITHGIYRIMRHPSYCGFFVWAIGTQFMLCNPISFIGFLLALWRFFSKRIPYEEFFLRQFFGRDYVEYARKVPSGLPFIK